MWKNIIKIEIEALFVVKIDQEPGSINDKTTKI